VINNEVFNFKNQNLNISNCLITMADSHGKLLSATPLNYSENQITINLKGVANGNYIVSLLQDRRIQDTKKLIISR